MGWRGHGPAKSRSCSPTDYMKYASRPLMVVQEVGKVVVWGTTNAAQLLWKMETLVRNWLDVQQRQEKEYQTFILFVENSTYTVLRCLENQNH